MKLLYKIYKNKIGRSTISKSKNGFSILELLAVIVMVSIVSTIIIITYIPSQDSLKIRTEIDRLKTLIRYTQSLAVTNQKVYSLNIKSDNSYEILTLKDTNVLLPPEFEVALTKLKDALTKLKDALTDEEKEKIKEEIKKIKDEIKKIKDEAINNNNLTVQIPNSGLPTDNNSDIIILKELRLNINPEDVPDPAIVTMISFNKDGAPSKLEYKEKEEEVWDDNGGPDGWGGLVTVTFTVITPEKLEKNAVIQDSNNNTIITIKKDTGALQ